MTLAFSPISSADTSSRDVAIDFTRSLEASELMQSATATSSDPSVLVVSDVYPNSAEIDKDSGGVIGIQKGVQMRLTTQQMVHDRMITVAVDITGDSNTEETYEVIVPVTDKLRH